MTNVLMHKLLAFGETIIPFIIALTVIVFVHELGHFLIARHNGVKVVTFSIGYGKELFGWTDKKGTRWRFSMLPFGGYVMMLGDADATSVRSNLDHVEENQKDQTLLSKTPLQRMCVSSGGPLMNIIFTLLIFMSIGLWKGIPDMTPSIQSVIADSIAQHAGLLAGDRITKVNDTPIQTLSQMKEALTKQQGHDVRLSYMRKDKEMEVRLPLYTLLPDGAKMPVNVIGITLAGDLVFTKASAWEAIAYGGQYCWSAAKGIVSGLTRAITGQKGGAKFGSILSIGDVAHSSMAHGMISFLHFMAMLSFSLAIFNLLPIPVLDGGSIMLSGVEWVRGKPLSDASINVVYTIGISVVALLMLWAMWNDLVRYHIVDKVVGWFH